FQFYFQFKYLSNQVNRLKQSVASFSTPFYVLEKNWFIRCDISNEYPYCAALYSLPFPLDQYTIVSNSFDQSISTLPNSNITDSSNNIYANVKTHWCLIKV